MKWAVLLLLSSGCATVSGVGSAVPLSPGTSEVQIGMGLQKGGNLLSRSTGYPLPAVGIGYRAGWKDGVDVGVRLVPLGIQTDIRLAIVTRERFHLAVSPGVSGSGLGVSSLGWGELGIHVPVMTELDVSNRWSLVAGVESTTFIRGGWLALNQETSGAGIRVDEYAGFAGGAYWKRGRWRLGWQASVATSLMRPAPTIWSTGPVLGVGAKSEKEWIE